MNPLRSGSFAAAFLLACLPVGPSHASAGRGPLFAASFVSFETSAEPGQVAAADLNSDGKLDLVAVNGFGPSGFTSVSVLLGRGDGTFHSHVDYEVGRSALALAVGDLNSDGIADLAITISGVQPQQTVNGAVAIMMGNGDGTFGTPTEYATTSGAGAVSIGDLNHDGNADLAVVSSGSPNSVGSIAIFLGSPSGALGPRRDFAAGTQCHSVRMGDLNEDGNVDLICSNWSGPSVSLLLGAGDGTFGLRTDLSVLSSPGPAEIGDLNHDGHLDLVWVSRPTETVSIALGNGDGTFRPRNDLFYYYPRAEVAGIADWNGDGKPDLVAGGAILIGVGDGTFVSGGSLPRLTQGPGSFAIADFQGDGKLDIAMTNLALTLYVGNGDGSFGIDPTLYLSRSVSSAAIGDVNGDFVPDLVVSNPRYPDDDYEPGTIAILPGSANGSFGPRSDIVIDLSPRPLAIGDLNGDGKQDLVFASYSRLSVLLGAGNGTFAPRVDYLGNRDLSSVLLADMNHDGFQDVVSASTTGSPYRAGVSIRLGYGDGTLGESHDQPTVYGAAAYAAVGDMNSDGNLDVAVVGAGSDSFAVLVGNGDGTLIHGFRSSGPRGSNAIAIGDLDEDGRPDLAVGGWFEVVTFAGNGDGTCTPKDRYPLELGADRASVLLADFDRDGHQDLAAVDWYLGAVSVRLGDGHGALAPWISYGTDFGSHFVTTGDLNRDGMPDLVVVNDETVSVLINQGLAPSVSMSLTLPGALNLRSQMRWLTAYLEPPAGLQASGIDVGSIRLVGNISGAPPVPVDPAAPASVGDQDSDGLPDLMVKFKRGSVDLALSDGPAVPVTVTGTIDGKPFSGSTTLRVLRAHFSAPAAGAVLSPEQTTTVRWETPPGITAPYVTILSSLDDGATWNEVAIGLPNDGEYEWTVPSQASGGARLAVVSAQGSDEVLGLSDAFTIATTIGVGNPLRVEFALHGVQPNPARERLAVEFSLPDQQPARLQVLDVAGRVVAMRDVAAFGPGRHRLVVSNRLHAGLYLVRLTHGEQVRIVRAVVIQ